VAGGRRTGLDVWVAAREQVAVAIEHDAGHLETVRDFVTRVIDPDPGLTQQPVDIREVLAQFVGQEIDLRLHVEQNGGTLQHTWKTC
jgi:hypothetical protein